MLAEISFHGPRSGCAAKRARSMVNWPRSMMKLTACSANPDASRDSADGENQNDLAVFLGSASAFALSRRWKNGSYCGGKSKRGGHVLPQVFHNHCAPIWSNDAM